MEITMKNVHANHRKRLRERFEREGAFSFEPHELLELFLFDAIPRKNTNETAHLLLERFGTLEGVFSAPFEELITVHGIGKSAAAYIVDSYNEFCADVEQKFTERKLDTFEQTSNLLIWRRSRLGDTGQICLILLSNDFSVLNIRDMIDYDVSAVSALIDAHQAARMIVGVAWDTESEVIERIKDTDIDLVDIIRIKGYNTESLLIPKEEALLPVQLRY